MTRQRLGAAGGRRGPFVMELSGRRSDIDFERAGFWSPRGSVPRWLASASMRGNQRIGPGRSRGWRGDAPDDQPDRNHCAWPVDAALTPATLYAAFEGVIT